MFFLATIFIILVRGVLTKPSYYAIGSSSDQESQVYSYNYDLVTRTQWLARNSTDRQMLSTPVPYVVIHHTSSPPACYSFDECSRAMRNMQNYHMDVRNWTDIGYNFAVGSDGAVYEGRGWETLGAHAVKFNALSIGIALIGDWTKALPPPHQLKTARSLIETGLELGFIQQNYKLVGHRQLGTTVCPGDVLYQEIQHWPHYST